MSGAARSGAADSFVAASTVLGNAQARRLANGALRLERQQGCPSKISSIWFGKLEWLIVPAERMVLAGSKSDE